MFREKGQQRGEEGNMDVEEMQDIEREGSNMEKKVEHFRREGRQY
jgi:hypothetical protein